MKVEDVHYVLGIARDLVPSDAIPILCKALSYLPRDVIEWVSENILFISPEWRGQGCWFPFSHSFFEERRGFILIPESSWEKPEIEITFIIAHETAHAFYGHTLNPFDCLDNTEDEISADKKTVEWLSSNFEEGRLRELCDYWKD